jgi:Flp pilus assembly protein TadG
VETALVLPILILLLAVIVDASRAFDAAMVLTTAVRQGARYASLEPAPDEAEIQQMVIDDIEGSGTNVSNMTDFGTVGTVTVEVDPTVSIKVTAEYDFPLWFGGILGFHTLHLERSASSRHAEAGP